LRIVSVLAIVNGRHGSLAAMARAGAVERLGAVR